MIARGEVALVVCNKGHEAGLFNGVAVGDPVVAVIMLVIVSSLLCPIFLKLAFKGEPPSLMGGMPEDVSGGTTETAETAEAIAAAESGSVGAAETGSEA